MPRKVLYLDAWSLRHSLWMQGRPGNVDARALLAAVGPVDEACAYMAADSGVNHQPACGILRAAGYKVIFKRWNGPGPPWTARIAMDMNRRRNIEHHVLATSDQGLCDAVRALSGRNVDVWTTSATAARVFEDVADRVALIGEDMLVAPNVGQGEVR